MKKIDKSFQNWIFGAGIALGLYLLYVSREVVPVLIISAIIAYILTPIVELLKRKLRFPNTLAVAVVFLVMVAVFAATSALVVQYLVEEIQNFAIDLQYIQDEITRYASEPIQFLDWEFDIGYLVPDLSKLITEGIPAISENALHLVEFTSKNIIWGLTIILVTFYLMLDWRDLRDWAYRLVPKDFQADALMLYRKVSAVWRGYLLGNLVLMLIIGVTFTIFYLIVGLPGAVALGVLAGILTFIPDLGPFLAAAVAAVVGLIQGSTVLDIPEFWFAVLIIVTNTVLINIKGLFIRPIVFGRSTKIHEGMVYVVILISLLAWGILGALIAVPVFASFGIIGGYFYETILGVEMGDKSIDEGEKKE